METSNKFKRTKYACYSAYVVTACVFSLPAILFVTFREMYDVSYALLGMLVIAIFPVLEFVLVLYMKKEIKK